MYKNKADLQFAIMQAGDNAAAQVHRTMERHLKCADELWRLADAAIAAGIGVRLPAMRWVNSPSPSLHLLADSDEAEIVAQRIIEEWAKSEGARVDACLRDGTEVLIAVAFEQKVGILAFINREEWQ